MQFYYNGVSYELQEDSPPAIDTITVVIDSGKVHLVNIQMDVKLFTLIHTPKSRGAKKKVVVTSLSFQTDALTLQDVIVPLAVGQTMMIVMMKIMSRAVEELYFVRWKLYCIICIVIPDPVSPITTKI